MAARFIALRDNCVAAFLLEPARLIHGCSGGQNLCARIPNASEKLVVRKTEVKADHLRLQLDDQVAHRSVERHSSCTRSRCMTVESQLDVVTRQPLSPRPLPRRIGLGWMVAEEVEIDRPGRSL